MKFTALLVFIAVFQVRAIGIAQTVTYSAKSVSLEKVISTIKQQTGYHFFYRQEDLPKDARIDVSLKGERLESALTKILTGLPLRFRIQGNTVFIVRTISEPPLDQAVVVIPEFIPFNGRITDSIGAPLVGATVSIRGKAANTLSNADGRFTIDCKAGDMLLISFVGYEQRSISITVAMLNSNTDYLVVLKRTTTKLEEVEITVNTGYQRLPKERATGSFSVIGKEQLDKPSTSIAQRLIGTTAGMQAILDADGNPRFEIRGQTTLNNRDANGALTAAGTPLVVVDGFPIQGDFSTINPNDVESVTVLKDAAAASIWGAKSANGVIIIVTKRGSRNAPLKVNLSAFTTFSSKLDLDYVNPKASSSEAVDFAILSYGKWDNVINAGTLSHSSFGSSPAFIALNEFELGKITEEERDAQLEKLRTLSNKDQIRKDLLANPSTQQYNLNISGGSDRMNHTVSLMYEDNQSFFKRTGNQKYNINYRTDADVFKWLQFSFSGLVNYTKSNNSGVTLADIQSYGPFQMLRNEDGTLTDISNYYKPTLERLVPRKLFPYSDWSFNPVQEIANRKLTAENFNTRLQLGLKFKIMPGLSFDSKIQYELFNNSNKNIYNDRTFRARNAVNTAVTWNQATNAITLNLPKGGILDQNRSRIESYNFRNQLNFDRQFGDRHAINFVGGSEVSSTITEFFGNPTTYGFNEETLSVGTFPNGPGGPAKPLQNWLGRNQTFAYTNSFSYYTDRFFSLFGNAAYTYDGKYTLSGSVRTDASNLITDNPSYRYAPFWSVGLGWQISKENFLQQASWIDQLNVRATYGFNGNVDKTTSFRPLISLAANPNLYTGDLNATVTSFGNPTLRWEKTGTWNVGVDYSLFHGQLTGKVDVYNKSGKDLIALLSIPAINGTTSQRLNNAQMTNQGIELELGTYQKIKGNDISWRGRINFSYNRNKITKLFVANYDAYSLSAGGIGAYVEGANANAVWRYKYMGLQNDQPMIQDPKGTLYDQSDFALGDAREFMVNSGTSVAPYTLGFINTFKIYDFNLSFIITGKFGHVFQRTGFNYPAASDYPNKKLSEVLNGDPGKILPLPLDPFEPNYNFWGYFFENYSYLMENASHIRMQEANLTYTIPSAILQSKKISRIQVYAQGNNLFTITANKVGEDPEYPLGTIRPQPRVTFGIKCEF